MYVLVIPFSFQRAIVCASLEARIHILLFMMLRVNTFFKKFFDVSFLAFIFVLSVCVFLCFFLLLSDLNRFFFLLFGDSLILFFFYIGYFME